MSLRAMLIATEFVGDVAVVRLVGKITLGEGDELLREAIKSTIREGRHEKIVLDLSRVVYIDSAGLGEVVRTFTTVARHGGRLVLCAPPRVLYDVGGPTPSAKLINIFQFAHSLEECLALFDPSQMYVECPVCSVWLSLLRGVRWPRVDCVGCGTRLSLVGESESICRRLQSGIGGVSCAVEELVLPTYENESVGISVEQATWITIRGRLDLFASEVVQRAWQLVPSPRRIILAYAWYRTEITPIGLAKVLELCSVSSDNDRTVLLMPDGLSGDLKRLLLTDARVYQGAHLALAAMAPLKESSRIVATIRLDNLSPPLPRTPGGGPVGANHFTAGDIEGAPVLTGREGEDVCNTVSLFKRFSAWVRGNYKIDV